MGGTLREQNLGPMRWLTASGEASDCFRALGGHMRAEIREAVTEWTSTQRLREHVSASPGREQLAAVRSATQAGFAAEWAELAALADGAGVSTEDLALLNFRGDLGQVEGGFNCSDLAWRRERSFIAHNEDQGASMTGRCVLLTLAIDGLPPVFAFWCPMFLPSNAFWVTSGLVLSIDSLTVPEPGPWQAATSSRAACSAGARPSTRPLATCGPIRAPRGSPTPSATTQPTPAVTRAEQRLGG